MSNYPIRPVGRRSGGLKEQDWSNLAMAYDTWNDHTAVAEVIDPDLKAFVKDVFDDYGLWDHNLDEPMLGQYRQMFMTMC